MLGSTVSLCPDCLKRIPAQKVAIGEDVFLVKSCPEHGDFRTIIWRGPPDYRSWAVPKPPSTPPVCATAADKGCPFDCGLCPEHRQHTCCVLLEVTRRCNLECPVCFAAAGGCENDPDIGTVENWYRLLLASGGPYNIQLSGGEPTLRDDLPEIIALGRSLGFGFFQLNTNGLRLAEDGRYGRRLKQAGLDCVFLQFDGLDDAVYEKIRGAALFAAKKAAISRCAELGLGVVLVPTLVPGINTAEIGRVIEFAVGLMPTVRGVHFQPVSYFGRYPQAPADDGRITIPEVVREIELQTGGRMKALDFRPPAAENAYCSFLGNFVLMADGELKPRTQGSRDEGCCQAPAAAGARRAQAFVARRWSAAGNTQAVAGEARKEGAGDEKLDSLDAFLERVDKYSLCVSGMAFQDVWNVDLDRLRDCFIHVVGLDSRIIPFCAYNITAGNGTPLYRPPGCGGQRA
ncbi:MAG TPA: radical SAM protein [Negativicutes bacterium]|nr:radical SAM protein [Negativicutes bacterium]